MKVWALFLALLSCHALCVLATDARVKGKALQEQPQEAEAEKIEEVENVEESKMEEPLEDTKEDTGETSDAVKVEEEDVGTKEEDPIEEPQEPVETKEEQPQEPVEEEPKPVEEEPTEEPVEEEPVEEEPVEEEPVEEEPQETQEEEPECCETTEEDIPKPEYTSPCGDDSVAPAAAPEGVCNWVPVAFETFENGAFGWSNNSVSTCGDEGCDKGFSSILGGPCTFSKHEVSKVFEQLPAHNLVRLRATVHLLDDWKKHTFYTKLDDHLVFTGMSPDTTYVGLNACGGSAADWMGREIDVVTVHDDDCLKVAFGSNLDVHPCVASYGIASVQVFICTHAAQGTCKSFSA